MIYKTIPAGYRITVESWENDADNYKTEVIEGLNRPTTQFVVAFCNLFRSRYKGGFGNMYDPSVSEVEKFTEAFEKVVADHINVGGLDNQILDYFVDETGTPYEDQHDGVIELAYELGLSGGEYFTRVVQKITIEYVPETITLEDVTHQFDV